MDRPTCRTCGHWEKWPTTDTGVCLRFPPHLVSVDFMIFQQPTLHESHRCSEHTNFPAFIESRKAPPQDKRGDVRLVAVISDDPYTDEPVTISREETERIVSLFASEPTTPPTSPPSPPPTPRE